TTTTTTTSTTTSTTAPTTTTTTTTSTTTSTSTTTTVTTSTTTTTVAGVTTLDFTVTAGSGTCGNTRRFTNNSLIKNLTCGGLTLGGGSSPLAEGPILAGSISHFSLSCAGPSCTVGSTSSIPPVNTAGPDCTNTGCNFGTPLPIVNGSLSTCVLNTWASPGSGTLNLTSGAASLNVPLSSYVVLTSNAAQPCPKCSAGGTPSSPGHGTCDRGPRATQPCTSTNPQGTTRDCPTGGADAGHPCTPGNLCIDGTFVGTISVDLSPAGTGTANKAINGGVFCPGQSSPWRVGCLGSGVCGNITETGVAPAGGLSAGVPKTGTLASVFCLPATGNSTIDTSTDL